MDLNRNSVCGISPDAPDATLSILGPPFVERCGLYCYPADGLSFFVWEGRIKTINVSFAKEDPGPEDKPFAGQVLLGTESVKLGAGTSDARIVELLGCPSKRYDDDEGMGLVYYRGNIDLHAKFGPRRTLLYVAINNVGEANDDNDGKVWAATTIF